MNLNNKNILVIGLAKTGLSTIKFLNKEKANIIVNDIKDENKLRDILNELNDLENIKFVLGKCIEDVSNIDLAIVSPGVPLDLPFIENMRNSGIEIIGDVELAYRILDDKEKMPKLVGITGTNGKTTTTSLMGALLENAKKDSYIVGNIGNPIVDIVDCMKDDSYVVAELSSFQLESINKFSTNISVVLNVTPDHLNRHHTMENYIDAKSRILINQSEDDCKILNYDDLNVRKLSNIGNGTTYYFSSSLNLEKEGVKGIYLEGEDIVINIDNKIVLMNKNSLSLPGVHNLENSMACALSGYLLGLDLDCIRETLSTFSGVAHRQEFVASINGVKYINDSKATNPDSTIKALGSYNEPIVLIAGGMDKKNDFTELMKEVKNNTKALIVLGETAKDIQRSAMLSGFENLIIRVYTMEEAVSVASKIAKKGDVVLLSPACASWDMYKNFEERGDEFKNLVLDLI